jgi:hypothetical protein
MQHRTPNVASTATRPVVIRLPVKSPVTLSMKAPRAAAMTNAPASTDQSRAVLGPSLSGWAESLGASIAVGAVRAHHLRSHSILRSYGSGLPRNIDESRYGTPTKEVISTHRHQVFTELVFACKVRRSHRSGLPVGKRLTGGARSEAEMGPASNKSHRSAALRLCTQFSAISRACVRSATQTPRARRGS